ncbi:hypothetical protein [Posidoniimonas polymericola]|uniref:hypothetical protein n=1 Tax=Posidoniimonas polymericola TaxID=2528002 RepID=UPI0011B51F43|nr:hypothetical protein [Posidoniimonas polymericola]
MSGLKKRRFAPDPGSPSFAVARSVLPTSGVSLAGTVSAGLLLSGGVLAGDYFKPLLPAALAGPLSVAAPSSVGGWLVASLMLVVALLCAVIYGLRSNRSDDVRGLYRWWLTAAIAGVALSAAYSVGAGSLVGAELTRLTGVTAVGNSGWWITALALSALVLGFRPVADLAESRLSLAFSVLAAAAVIVSWCGAAGAVPAQASEHAQLVQSGGLLIGLVMAAAAQLAFVRRVLLETDGVIAAPEKKEKPAKKVTKASPDAAATKQAGKPAKVGEKPATVRFESKPAAAEPVAEEESPAPSLRRDTSNEAAASEDSRWTDGSDADADYDDDNPRRKLSKAERKRLRKSKAGGRYAA